MSCPTPYTKVYFLVHTAHISKVYFLEYRTNNFVLSYFNKMK